MEASIVRQVLLHVVGDGVLGSLSHSPALGERLALAEQEMRVVEVACGGSPPVLVSAGLKPVEGARAV